MCLCLPTRLKCVFFLGLGLDCVDVTVSSMARVGLESTVGIHRCCQNNSCTIPVHSVSLSVSRQLN